MRIRSLLLVLFALALALVATAGPASARSHASAHAKAAAKHHAAARHHHQARRHCVRVRVRVRVRTRHHHGRTRAVVRCRTVRHKVVRRHTSHHRSTARSRRPATHTSAAAPPATAASPACTNTLDPPTPANLAAARAATLCLLNVERARAGLGPLRENGVLDAAARSQSTNMVALHIFDHTLPGTGGVVARLLRSGYVNRNEAWSVGENIAWGTERLASPQAIVTAWMNSPDHRANILTAAFHAIGIGIVTAIPAAGFGGQPGATYTTDFGSR